MSVKIHYLPKNSNTNIYFRKSGFNYWSYPKNILSLETIIIW